MGWGQLIKNLAEKGDFCEPRRRDEAGCGASGRLGSPGGLAAWNPSGFPPAARGNPKCRRRDPTGEAADAYRKKGASGAGGSSRRKKGEVTAATAIPARPGATGDATEGPLQEEPPAAGPTDKVNPEKLNDWEKVHSVVPQIALSRVL